MSVQTDVIVIGAGLAGMVAALEARSLGAAVILVDKGHLGIGNNTVLAGGRMTGPTSSYSLEDHMKDTFDAGRGINRDWMVRRLSEESSNAFAFVRSCGLKLMEGPRSYDAGYEHPDSIGGITLAKGFAGKVRSSIGIEVLTGLYVTEILRDGDRAFGIKSFSRRGEDVPIHAPAVVLATGGAGALYLRNDNQRDMMGQGYYLAAKAGVDLWDMEFVQFHPLVVAEPRLPSLVFYGAPPPGMKLLNSAGENLLSKYDLGDSHKAKLAKRDEFSAIVLRESLQGPVLMDCRSAPSSYWTHHPFGKLKFDFSKNPFAVSPGAHFSMGGVQVNDKGETSLPGVYACGEVVAGLHGANRLGGNALTECLVFGRTAGQNAARYAHFQKGPAPHLNPAGPSRLSPPLKPGILKECKRSIREIAWTYAGVIRNEQGLKEGLARIAALEQEVRTSAPQSVPERRLKEDLESAAFVLKATLVASLPRKETRGAFIRDDFPEQDDLRWRKNSCLSYDPESNLFSLSYHLSS